MLRSPSFGQRRAHNLQRRSHRPLGVVLVRHWVCEAGKEALTGQRGDPSFVLAHDLRAGPMKRPDALAQIFGILSVGSGRDQVARQKRHLSTCRPGRQREGGHRGSRRHTTLELAQRGSQLLAVLIPLSPIHSKGTCDHAIGVLGQRHAAREQRRGPLQSERGSAKFVELGAGVRQLAGQQLEQHDPRGPNVGARVEPLPAPLLGCHVADGPRPRKGGWRLQIAGQLFARGRPREACQPEIEDLRPPVLQDEDVWRLQVAVDDAALVSMR